MRDHQVNKFYTPWSHESSIQLQYKTPTVYHTIQYFNSNIFLSYLEDLTGIKGLKGDPNFAGGGAHRISTGGKLSLHVDLYSSSDKSFSCLKFIIIFESKLDAWSGGMSRIMGYG